MARIPASPASWPDERASIDFLVKGSPASTSQSKTSRQWSNHVIYRVRIPEMRVGAHTAVMNASGSIQATAQMSLIAGRPLLTLARYCQCSIDCRGWRIINTCSFKSVAASSRIAPAPLRPESCFIRFLLVQFQLTVSIQLIYCRTM